MQRLILASQSPRRKELLDRMGLAGTYQVIPSEFEEQLDDYRDPVDVSQELGYGKALWVAERNPGAWVIGSDTIVLTAEGKQLGKPHNEQEALDMLKLLAGETNRVVSSAVLVRLRQNASNERIIKHYIGSETSIIHFKPYDPALVGEYMATGGWKDKAGAYDIQSPCVLADRVSGNYDAIVGLPTHLLAAFLHKAGFEAHPVDFGPDDFSA